ncbi:TPA: hypothetical protein ACPZN0_004380 [Yersinia enterocolitica]|uniref:hypothetical protein n=1 Tax=Yersinia enterocolitica TaxID=630 RepID=UPI0033048168|nr:hypothetical protein [Yersinia enterocolitica]HDM8392744.1 hypothetical protein [Yersinia enterocolitica]HDM8395039.1 hypothetical protein [Yersinia enterocolitica]HDM8452082.1 hypothetical protein [Yersinia enterocolitica]
MNTIEVKVNVDTAPIDSLITKLERAVELQKQLTPKSKPRSLISISVEPAPFGVVVSWSEWWAGAARVRVYSKCRRGDETVETCSWPVSSSQQSYLINGLAAGQSIECHVRFYDNDGKEIFRSATVTGKANSDASEILNAMPFAVDTGQTYSLRAGIHIDSFILGGTVAASTIESSLASIKELQDNVAAIIATAIENQQYIERVNHQRSKDFVALSKAVRSVEESISLLIHQVTHERAKGIR